MAATPEVDSVPLPPAPSRDSRSTVIASAIPRPPSSTLSRKTGALSTRSVESDQTPPVTDPQPSSSHHAAAAVMQTQPIVSTSSIARGRISPAWGSLPDITSKPSQPESLPRTGNNRDILRTVLASTLGVVAFISLAAVIWWFLLRRRRREAGWLSSLGTPQRLLPNTDSPASLPSFSTPLFPRSQYVPQQRQPLVSLSSSHNSRDFDHSAHLGTSVPAQISQLIPCPPSLHYSYDFSLSPPGGPSNHFLDFFQVTVPQASDQKHHAAANTTTIQNPGSDPAFIFPPPLEPKQRTPSARLAGIQPIYAARENGRGSLGLADTSAAISPASADAGTSFLSATEDPFCDPSPPLSIVVTDSRTVPFWDSLPSPSRRSDPFDLEPPMSAPPSLPRGYL